MNSKVKKWLIVILIAFLCIGWATTIIYDRIHANRAYKKQDMNTAALLDTYKKIIDPRGDEAFIGKVVEALPKNITKTETFDRLEASQQKQIEELANIKNLLASMEVRLSIVNNRIDKIAYNLNEFAVSNDSVTFSKGANIMFEDTIGNYQFREFITFNDSIVRDFRSTLKLEPSFRFTRNRDKSIDATISFGKIEGNQLTIDSPLAFYIPSGEKARRHPKAYKIGMETLKWTARIGIPSLSFYAGTRLGIAVQKSINER